MAELRGDEMKMAVPGDAGYEVERFTEKSKCETCGEYDATCSGVDIPPELCYFKPKSSPVLGEIHTQFLCSDTNKFAKELQALIDEYTSDSMAGLDVTIDFKSYS